MLVHRCTHTDGHTHTDTDTHAHRHGHRHTHTDTDTDMHTDTETHAHGHRHRHSHTHTDMDTWTRTCTRTQTQALTHKIYWNWRDSSVAETLAVLAREGPNSAQNHLFQGTWDTLLISMGTSHLVTARIYIQAKLSYI